MPKTLPFTLDELGNTYVLPSDRYVVSLVYGCSDAASPVEAARRALNLTRDDQSFETRWHVFDRETGLSIEFEQHELDED